jgi:hypothetical protein
VTVTLMLALACKGNTRGALLDSDIARLPPCVPPPLLPPADPPQPDKIKRERRKKKNHATLLVMSGLIVPETSVAAL